MKKRKAFTLIELLVVVAIIALLISILLPSLSRARELSKRLVCAANLKGLGTSFKIYANDNEESWPIAAHDESSDVVIQYASFADWASPSLYESLALDFSTQTPQVGRGIESIAEIGGNPGTTQLSTTRSLWMLVRSGDVTPKQFICPSSGDSIEQEANIDIYYDFRDLDNVSYGYQVPYGPFDTRASESSDPRLAVAADKGPYSSATPPGPPANDADQWQGQQQNGGLSPQEWRRWNSGNHGGRGSGEGQNVLFADGHATFEKTPLASVDNDNIYTHMLEPTGSGDDFGWRISGFAPNNSNAYPGQDAFGTDVDATTDSLIYP